MVNAKVVQTTSNHHDQIGKIILRVSQYILHTARTLDSSNGMFNADTDFGYLAIAPFLFGSQFFLTRLFFG